ncbi:MAG: aspartate-semialdehyde dehydrogenase [Fimbriimonadia bacterium]|nr:aspartate-semialdehyde dehydrogenase [Fimbriimonadia bacterium]
MGFKVAIVGATGAVGQELLRTLERRSFPVSELRLLASERSAGKTMAFQGFDLTVEPLREDAFQGCEVAFFSAGASRSREFAPPAVTAGALVIDNSSAFRMDPSVPLVIPEINIDHAREHRGIIANPNCSAIILLMAVAPLMRLASIERIVVSTYQAASGAGAQAIQELLDQTRDYIEGKPVVPKILPHPYAFNLFSHNTPINEYGYNEEEWKVIQESRKILNLPDLRLGVTCARVPVLRAHSESITVEFDHRPSLDMIYGAYERFPGVRVVDDRANNYFPMPLDASGQDEVLVGRIREDVSHPQAVSLFAAGDQLLKGAALNAVQIAESLL